MVMAPNPDENGKVATVEEDIPKPAGTANEKANGSPKDAKIKKHENKEDELSNEDQELKEALELLVERAQDPEPGIQKLALENMRQEIRRATSSTTSFPQALKFLQPHYKTLKAIYNTTAPENKTYVADVISWLATTIPEDGARHNVESEAIDLPMKLRSVMAGDTTPASTTTAVNALAVDGERRVAELIGAAHEILAELYETMSDTSFWRLSEQSSLAASAAEASGIAASAEGRQAVDEACGQLGGPSIAAALEAPRVRYRATANALRTMLNQIGELCEPQDAEHVSSNCRVLGDNDLLQNEVAELEHRAAQLRKEMITKNDVLKSLIDHMRALVEDITLWQSSPLVPMPS